MQRRAPRFVVITNALVGLAVAGFALKFAARYLPERQPNRLALEYGAYVRDAQRQKVDWHPFGEEPFLIARKSRKLIFLEVGNLFSRAGRIFQREHLEDEELIRTLNSHFVCIKSDSLESPWLVASLALNSTLLQDTEGCLLVILDSNGLVLDQSPVRTLVTLGGRTGMLDWLKSFAERRISDRKGLSEIAATNLGIRSQAAEAANTASVVDKDMARQLVERWHDAWIGGSIWRPAFAISHVQADMFLEAGAQRDAAAWLIGMRASPSYDQAGAGFFSKSELPLWRRPGYGKHAGSNALLGAAYAKGSVAFGAVVFQETARDIARWLLNTVRDPQTGLFRAGVATDEGTLEGSPYYDWRQESLVGRASLVFSIWPPGAVSGPLELRKRDDWSALQATQIAAARDALAPIRRQLTQPETDGGTYADVCGKVLSGLAQIARVIEDDEIEAQAISSYAQVKAAFVQTLGDVLHAPEGLGRTTGYAGDYVWFARAALDVYAFTGDPTVLNDAGLVMARFIELFGHPAGGFVTNLQSLAGFAPFALPIREVADQSDQSINALAARNCRDLAAITHDPRLQNTALNTLTAFAGAMKGTSLAPAGYVAALLHLYQPVLLVNSRKPSPLLRLLASRFPTYFSARAGEWFSDRKEGIYIDREGRVTGPFSVDEVAEQIQLLTAN
jgi:uncharacterized protein YyaL (SSP411 family)